jgi:hypothetical protein
MGACFEWIPGGSSCRYREVRREEDLGNGNGGATTTPRSVGMGAPSAPAQPPATGASRPPTPPDGHAALRAIGALRDSTALATHTCTLPSARALRRPPARRRLWPLPFVSIRWGAVGREGSGRGRLARARTLLSVGHPHAGGRAAAVRLHPVGCYRERGVGTRETGQRSGVDLKYRGFSYHFLLTIGLRDDLSKYRGFFLQNDQQKN